MTTLDLSRKGNIFWFTIPGDEKTHNLKVNLSFLASNWRCQYGTGCPGLLYDDKDTATKPDVGCCSGSFYVYDQEEQDQITQSIDQLTGDIWDDELRARYEKLKSKHGSATEGWASIKKPFKQTKGGEYVGEVKGRVYRGACIFANRTTGSAGSQGKPGCAWLHLGNKLNAGKNDITANSEEHANFMPRVCSQLPIKNYYTDEGQTQVIDAWSTNAWYSEQDEPDFDDEENDIKWWCVEDPDSYSGENPVVISMELELRKLLGDANYETVRTATMEALDLIKKIAPMPPSPEGRTLLPTLPAQTVSAQLGI